MVPTIKKIETGGNNEPSFFFLPKYTEILILKDLDSKISNKEQLIKAFKNLKNLRELYFDEGFTKDSYI
jgi:hypothetical protein